VADVADVADVANVNVETRRASRAAYADMPNRVIQFALPACHIFVVTCVVAGFSARRAKRAPELAEEAGGQA